MLFAAFWRLITGHSSEAVSRTRNQRLERVMQFAGAPPERRANANGDLCKTPVFEKMGTVEVFWRREGRQGRGLGRAARLGWVGRRGAVLGRLTVEEAGEALEAVGHGLEGQFELVLA